MEGGDTQREKRFKVRTPFTPHHTELSLEKQHQSYQATLKDVHLPSALTQSEFDHDIGVRSNHLFYSCSQEAELPLLE